MTFDPSTATPIDDAGVSPRTFDPTTARLVSEAPVFDVTTARPLDDRFDPASAELVDDRRDVGAGESFVRGAKGAAYDTAAFAGKLLGAAPIAYDAAKSALTGTPSTDAQDAYFKQFVDPAEGQVHEAAINPATEKQGFGAQIAGAGGQIAVDLPAMIATGGESAAAEAAGPMTRILNTVAHGAKATLVPGTRHAADDAQDLLAQGKTGMEAAAGAARTLATDIAINSAPIAAKGDLLTRVATGAAVGGATQEASRELHNAFADEQHQEAFDPMKLAVGAVQGAATAGVLGERASVRDDGHVDVLSGAPSRADFSPNRPELRAVFDPTTAEAVSVDRTAVTPTDALTAARAAFDAQVGDAPDFAAARPIAERVAAEHGVNAADILPAPDWIAESPSAQQPAGTFAPSRPRPADGPVFVGIDRGESQSMRSATSEASTPSAAPTSSPRDEAQTQVSAIPKSTRAADVADALSNLEGLGLDAESVAMIRGKLTDEQATAQEARAAAPAVNANTESRSAGEHPATTTEGSHAQGTPDAAVAVNGQPETLDALIDQAHASGATPGEVAVAARSTDDAVAAQALRDLIARKTDEAAGGEEAPGRADSRSGVDAGAAASELDAGRSASEADGSAAVPRDRSGSGVRRPAPLHSGLADGPDREVAPPGAAARAVEGGDIGHGVERAETAGLAPAERSLPARVAAAARAWREQGTASPFFQRFFHGSKVTVDDGAPRVVYHGTGAEFTVFSRAHLNDATAHSTSPLGFFFADARGAAEHYATNASEGRPADARVVDAYVAIKRPYTMTMDEAHAIESPEQARRVRADLERRGFDGIRIPEAGSWIAFRPEQIKSASENRGTFDTENADIRFSRGPRPAQGMTRAAAEAQSAGASRVLAQHGIRIELHDTPDTFPESVRGHADFGTDAKGVADGDTIHVAASNIADAAELGRVIAHEAAGHIGVERVAGSRWSEIARAVHTLVNTSRRLGDLARRVEAETGAKRGTDAFAREVIARAAEEPNPGILLGRAWTALRSAAREFVRPFGMTIEWNEADLDGLVRQATRRVGLADSARGFARRDLDGAERAALDKIGVRGESLGRKLERLSSRWREKAVQGLVDQFAPLKDLDPVAYMQARLSRGTDGAVEAAFLHGLPKLTDGALDVAADGKGLRGVLADLAGEHDLFFAWIAGNRAERLAREGRERLFTDSDVTALKRLNRGTMPDGRSRVAAYARALAEFNRYQRAVMDIAEHAGLVSADARAKWAAEFYVPFRRVDLGESGSIDPAELVPPPAKKGTPEPIEQLKGGAQPLGDLLGNVLENWSRLLTSSMRNMAATKALTAAEAIGEAHRVEEPSKTTLRARMNGKPVYFDVDDPLVVDALTMLNFNGWQSPALRVMSKFKRALSFGVTQSPSFRIRNLLRDTLSALAVSDHTDANPLRNLVDGWKATAHGSATDVALLAGGGKVRFGSLTDGDHAAHAKRLIRMGVDEKQILDTPAKLRHALTDAWHRWQELGDRGESVNRAVIYQRARAAGKSHLEASYEARDLLDFTMGGKFAAVRFLAQTVPFLNARAQGIYRLIRGAAANPQRFAAVTGAVALASVALYLAQRNDEDYKALPDWTRDSYWVVKLGDKFVYLPKPFEIGAFGTVVERATELAVGGDDYQAHDFAASLWSIAQDQLAMNPIPQVAKPALESLFNYDTFRDRPIDSATQQRLPPGNRYTSSTSAAAVELGKATGTSPSRIEHLVTGYLGWLGVQALSVADAIVRPFTDLPGNPRRDVSKVDNVFVVGDFVKNAKGGTSKYVDRLYSMQQQLEQVYAARREALRAGDRATAESLEPGLQKLGMYRGGAHALTRIRAEARQIENDPTLSAREKRQRLDALAEERNRVAADVDGQARAEQ
jgi:hypothetical protein